MTSQNRGKINLILGCMFSGKTSTLISRYNRYTIGGKKCIMVKYKHDTRYDKKKIVTHDHIKVDAIVCEYLFQIDDMVKNYDVICIDEIQFYKDAPIFCDKWANQGKIVEVCGLNGTFERKPFVVINKLLPKVEDITFLTAVCRETGNNAHYSKRLIDNDNEQVIGGAEIYSAADRHTFIESDIEDECSKFREFVMTYNEINKIRIPSKLIDKFINHFRNEYSNHHRSSDGSKYLSYTDIIKECFKQYDTMCRFIKN